MTEQGDPQGRLRIPAVGPIVIVDDGEVDRFVLLQVLARTGFSHPRLEFDSGRAFLEHMERVQHDEADLPALVLLDINMPQLNGFEVMVKIRQRPRFASRPAVAMVTNSPAIEDAHRAGEVGADRLIRKGTGLAELAAELDATFVVDPRC